ncbi:unnamed protein product [Mesocestoides corti]|uniref:Lipoma HMGIC fusion partner-like 2 protein n=1 Tax=Mesocestoides corti TaxID=53468 RepID=A0A0R3UKU0_MESCO|nr:unnamed protein product [Mesocestoides corti]
MRCFWVLWSLLAWSSAVLCTVGCLFPYWLKGALKFTLPVQNGTKDASTELLTSHIGLFRRCVYPVYATSAQTKSPATGISLQSNCGHYTFSDIPHLTWKVGLVTLAVACVLLFFITFFLFVSGFNISLLAHSGVNKVCQFGFLVSGLLVIFTCVMYPVGWRMNDEVRQICGSSADSFNPGGCDIGWAYIATIIGGFVSLLATLLPRFFPTHTEHRVLSVPKHNQIELHNGVFVAASTLPPLLARNPSVPTPTDQSSVHQGSCSRKASSVQGAFPTPSLETSFSSSYGGASGFRVLVPATPVIIQSP